MLKDEACCLGSTQEQHHDPHNRIYPRFKSEDMTLRKLSPKTQTVYLRVVKQFTGFLKQSPDSASAENLIQYQLHLVEQGISSGGLNATITELTFFLETTLARPEVVAKMSHV